IATPATADAAAFAAEIASLYRDETRWTALRDSALRRLAAENGRAPFEATVRRILDAISA
ncbi:hypothetical protein, partial [Acidiphilium sp.]